MRIIDIFRKTETALHESTKSISVRDLYNFCVSDLDIGGIESTSLFLVFRDYIRVAAENPSLDIDEPISAECMKKFIQNSLFLENS